MSKFHGDNLVVSYCCTTRDSLFTLPSNARFIKYEDIKDLDLLLGTEAFVLESVSNSFKWQMENIRW